MQGATYIWITYSPGEAEKDGRSPYTHAPVHPAVNGYQVLVRGCDLLPGNGGGAPTVVGSSRV